MSDFMLESLTESEARVRKHVRSLAPADMLFAFDLVENLDLSDNDAGVLFEQDRDFYLFEIAYDSTGRAGPGMNSPGRAWATLDLAVYTKQPRDKVKFGLALEAVANWFQNKTVDGMRFRTYLPTSTVPMHGFTSYNGVINFQFEIVQTGS